MKKAETELRPVDARTFDQICALPRDGFDGETWWLSLDPDSVTVCQQKSGQASTGRVRIPRRDFDGLIAWYTGQPSPRRRG